MADWQGNSMLVSVNPVNLYRAWLVQRRVTIRRFKSRSHHLEINQTPNSLSLAIPPGYAKYVPV